MFLAYLLGAFCAMFIAWLTTYVLLQRHRKRRARLAMRRRHLVISPLSGIVIGAALVGFQALVQPHVRHIIAEAQEDEKSDDELPGGQLFHSHLRKIRTGEELVDLSVRTDS